MKSDEASENHIYAYYQQIQNGGVTVGNWVRMWYKRVIAGLENKEYRFDQRKAEIVINFVERYCRHHEGALAPNLIQLELWQKAFISVVFGCVDEDGHRHFREVLLVIGRKNGKTLLAAALSAYMLFHDGEYGARVYFCAPKLDQARLCYEGLYQTILKDKTMTRLSKKRRTDIYVESCNSSAMPLAFSAKKSDGLNPHLLVCDELAAWQGDPGLKQYEVGKSALGARSQPLLLSITTAGYVNDGIYDEMMKRSTAVLQGTSHESRLAPFLYIIDDPEKWNDINELRKSNPNLGVSVSVDYMLEEIAVAEGSLSKRVEFLTKYANIKQNSSLAWMPSETVRKCFTENKTLEDFRGCYALGGIDLSQTTDLTACALLIQKGGKVYIFTRFFIPREKIEEATIRDGIPYDFYIRKGWLIPSGDNLIDYHDCFNFFTGLVNDYNIYPLQIGYDRYSAQYLVQDMEAAGFHMESVFQGTNLTGIINTTEGMLKDVTLVSAEQNDLMKIHMMDSALKLEDETNRKKLIKISKNAHVDGMAALLDAMCMRANHWEEYQVQLANEG